MMSCLIPCDRIVLLVVFGWMVTHAPAEHCRSCYDHENVNHTCQSDEAWKTVDQSGMCGPFCGEPYCGEQIGLARKSCRFGVIPDCSLAAGRSRITPGGVYVCPGASSSHCPDGECSGGTVASGTSDDSVVLLAYPWSCPCQFPPINLTALDIRIRFNGWKYFSLTVSNSDDAPLLCRYFHVTWSSSAPLNSTNVADVADGERWLRYDCPFFEKREEGGVYRVSACVEARQTLFVFRLPFYHNAAGRSEAVWRPLIVHHAHHRHQLVYSIQRGPAQLCRRRRRAALVRCLSPQCRDIPAQAPFEAYYTTVSAAVTLQFNCSDESVESSRVIARFDWPTEAGSYALLLYWSNGSYVLSTPLHYEIASSYCLHIYVASLLIPFLVALCLLLRRLKHKQNSREVESVDVLILYNCRRRLVLDLAKFLQIHCNINCLIDVINVPRIFNQDPVEWLLTAVKQHTNILVLWLPVSPHVPPPLYRLFHTALSQLTVNIVSKNVVVATVHCSSSQLPHQLLPFKLLQLPGQLRQVVEALRGPLPGLRKSLKSPEAVCLLQSMETSNDLSEETRDDVFVEDTGNYRELSRYGQPPLLLQPSLPPRRWPELLLRGTPSALVLAQPKLRQQPTFKPPVKVKSPALEDIVWH